MFYNNIFYRAVFLCVKFVSLVLCFVVCLTLNFFMKKTTSLLVIALLMACLTSCSVKIAAPTDKNIQLANAYEPLPIRHKITNWYAFFGILPISKNNSTDYVIHSLNLEKVRITNKVSFGNFLLNLLLNFNFIFPTTLVTTTTIIEGSPRPPATTIPVDR
jgi:hypothetical protein